MKYLPYGPLDETLPYLIRRSGQQLALRKPTLPVALLGR